MKVPGFTRIESGPNAGLYIADGSNIELHGALPGTPERAKLEQQKIALIRKFVETELRLDTKHFDFKGNRLRKPDEVMRHFAEHGCYLFEMPADRRWKTDAVMNAFGEANDGTQDAGGASSGIIHP